MMRWSLCDVRVMMTTYYYGDEDVCRCLYVIAEDYFGASVRTNTTATESRNQK